MAISIIISVIPPTVCFVLALFLISQKLNNSVIKLFIMLLFSLVAYGLVQVIIQTFTDTQKVADLICIRTGMWGLIVPLSIHTIIKLLKNRHRLLYAVQVFMSLYGVAIIILSLLGFSMFKDYNLASWGWNAVLDNSSWFYWFMYMFLIIGTLLILIILIATMRRTEQYKIQRLAQAIMINLSWGSLFTILPYFWFINHNLPAEIVLAYSGNIAIFLITLTIQKYYTQEAFNVSALPFFKPFLPPHSMIITLKETIPCSNTDKLFLGGYSHKNLEEMGWQKLFKDPAIIRQQVAVILQDPDEIVVFNTQCYTVDGDIEDKKVCISGLKNDSDELIAFLFVFVEISKKSNAINYLKNTYFLSNREEEIALLLLERYTNTEISNHLFISLNTVKTHTRNIYQKTGTTNRLDLFNLCMGVDF